MSKNYINLKDNNDPMEEVSDIVDDNDNVIGMAKRIDFLKDLSLMRRSAHIWLKNSEGKFWMHKRGAKKDLQPLSWTCAAAGFVRSAYKTKDQIKQEALRELKEEIGVVTDIKLIQIMPLRGLETGDMMVYWYFGKSDGPFKINKSEVADIKAFDLEEVWQMHLSGDIELARPYLRELKYYLNHKIF